MSITQNLKIVKEQIPVNVKLVCVSKFNPNASILEAYHTGQRHFGESKVQELCGKYESLPKDIAWHFIGHLQTNKVKYIIPFVELIHGVDSLKLLQEINKQAQKQNRVVDCLLQVHIAMEETKFGFSSDEIVAIFEHQSLKEFGNVRIRGLMGMASFTSDMSIVSNEFRMLKNLFDDIKTRFLDSESVFTELSMGMSDDYLLAIQHGSTIVRVGSKIFGQRIYT